MARQRCPTGVICTDWTTVVMISILILGSCIFAYMFLVKNERPVNNRNERQSEKIIIVQSPSQQRQPPSVYAEPTLRYPIGLPTELSRGPVGAYGQVGIMTGEGGSSSSAAPDRTILPLYGREIDARRGRWNYYTRTDGANPVQVPVRYKNRVCDDDVNGCDEIFNDESVHVPSLGRAFKTTIYRKSLFS